MSARAARVLALVGLFAAPASAADHWIADDAEAFAEIVPPDAQVRQLAGGMKFTEGPVWIEDEDGGLLVFSDIPANNILSWSAAEGLAVVRTPSNHANGNAVDPWGRLISCEHGSRAVTMTPPNGPRTVLVDSYRGQPLNSPNDAVVGSDGTIWFTDPTYGLKGRPQRQPAQNVYRFDPETGDLTAVATDFVQPNGLCLSPDEDLLYVADSGKPRHIRVFEIEPGGELAGGQLFADCKGADGIRCDADGRVWSSAEGGVSIYAADGHLIGRILVPEKPANLCFGGQDGRTLFITARTSLYAIDVNVTAPGREAPGEDTRPPVLVWRDAQDLSVEGQAWPEQSEPYTRLPDTAEEVVRGPVWRLSRDSAGVAVRFRSDARRIEARWWLRFDRLAMPHMPSTGVSGLDLYVRKESGWRWLGIGQPGQAENHAVLARGLPEGEREFLLYLPLYNGVESLMIGAPASASIFLAAPRPEASQLPVVFYGTSITQGGCASRPGMCHPAILGRWLDRTVVNLGFSGNGTMELELADLMAEIDAAVYVVDCLPNMNEGLVQERIVPFVERLRELRPETPILLVEDRTFANAVFNPARQRGQETSRAALRAGFAALVEAGTRHLHYLEGANLLGDDGEATVDGSHPTDLGFWRQAKVMRPVLEKLLR